MPAILTAPTRGVAPEWVRPTLFFGGYRLKPGTVLDAIRSIAERVSAGRGFELVDAEVKRDRSGYLVRLYVDREGGIALDDLEEVSNEVSAILDAEDPVASPYTLEVSSPGLDRPLRSDADYRRFVGRLAKLSSYEPLDGRRHWTGRLLGVEGGAVSLCLEKEGGIVATIAIDKIAHGRLEVEFPKQTR